MTGRQNRAQPGKTAAWRELVDQGLAGELADYVIWFDAHYGYEPEERPRYGVCACDQGLRLDRIDLLAEHFRACTAGRARRRIAFRDTLRLFGFVQ